MPPLSIKAPYWTRPVLLDTGLAFHVVMEHPPAETPIVALVGDGETIPVRVEDAASLSPGMIAYTCIALGGRPSHMYDLEVQVNDQSTTMPNAVGVLPRDAEILTLLHCSDLHLLKPSLQGTLA